ncbi:hypothetical protein BP6252_04234 [Coleophoma cylindrospora]|uniref:DUF7907 domain-containing protein n=1 Tax=Coleophoma cylindrospora TaxID=1849047 RepID=A0A3D8RZY1_9HELO|nr:hypothetical protein BP6252_04234 [Coleophoma cylindrospora]
MAFSMFKSCTTLALTSLFLTSTAAPTTRQAPNYAPTSQSDTFKVIANVTGTDLPQSVNGWALTSYHLSAGAGYAVLVDPTTPSRDFYINGTASEVRFNSATVASDGGSPPFPWGMVVNSPANTVSINAGLGEQGLGLTIFPDPVPKLHGPASAGWYACDAALPSGDAVQLFSLPLGDTAPAGCAQVTLLPQCTEGDGVEHPFANTVNCYPDVAGIDWTVYSA